MQLNFNSWINKDFSSTEVNSTWSLRQLFSRQFLLYSRFNSHFCFGSVVQQGTKLRGRVRINRSVQHFYIKALSLASFQRSSPTDKSACTQQVVTFHISYIESCDHDAVDTVGWCWMCALGVNYDVVYQKDPCGHVVSPAPNMFVSQS